MKRLYIFFVIALLVMPLLAAQENTPDTPVVEAASAEVNDAPDIEPVHATDTDVEETELAAKIKHLAEDAKAVEEAIVEDAASRLGFVVRLGIALAVLAAQALIFRLLWKLFNSLSFRVTESGREKIKPLTIKKIKVLSTQQIIDFALVLLKILKYVVSGFLLFLTIPIEFSLFPATRHLATTIFGYIFNPLKDIIISAIRYIPNLFTIVIIVVVTHYVIKLLKFFSTQIAKGRLVLNGFYADWAEPTYKILQVLLWAFTVAIAYPYLPGSESRVFQGVSVFVGLIFSLGSSSAIGNLVAGLVITYMRPFKIGDRVQIKETTGFVVEKNLMVVRIRTHKNEYVTFPNVLILGSSITNYNTSTGEDAEGLILYAEVTFGYATPWEKVHEILINAALASDYVQKKPMPFVLQTGLDNFYARYQINCYTKEVDKVPKIYASLYEHIQNGFHEAGMDMTCANYGVYELKKAEERNMN
ncbi:MAG: mechanosensitive ion channel family protein [Treponema sp.]|jgi:small-conductance mechanosensitive channel|nr:mechanosensitive ion channel family protein [Treponema sp.]